MSWRQVLEWDYRHIAVASSTDGGETFSAGTIVSDDRWQLNACPVSGAAIAASNGNLNVVWYTAGEAGQAGYYIAQSTGGGAFGSRVLVSNNATSGMPVLLTTSAGLKLVHASSEDRAILAVTTNQGTAFAEKDTIEHASSPVAVFANGATYIAYVSTRDANRSVWLAKR